MSGPLDSKLATPCGSYCGECQYHQKGVCKGCGDVKGKPFWGECRFYPCAAEKKIEHCGLCGEFPCEYFLTTYDPNEGAWRVFYRAGQLAYRKRIGTEAWIQQKIDGKIGDPKQKK